MAGKAQSIETEARVDYTLPRNALGSDPYVTVIRNGVACQIQCGKKVSIPEGIAAILDGAVAEKQKLDEKVERLTSGN